MPQINGQPDATTTSKGKILLAGDLTGTAALPTIANLAVTAAKIETQQAWQTPTYTTGVIDFDAGGSTQYGGVRYMKDSLGFVHIKGILKNNTGSSIAAATVLLTLPAGYRPAQILRFVGENSGSLSVVCMNASGGFYTDTTALPNGAFVSLSGITYKAEA